MKSDATANSIHDMERSLWKNRVNLTVLGLGVIAYGLWSVIKTILYTALHTDAFLDDPSDLLSKIILWIFVILFILIEMSIRLFIGRGAIAEGKRGTKRRGYILMALFLGVFNIALAAVELFIEGMQADYTNVLVEAALDVTSGIILLELAAAALKSRSLQKVLQDA